MSRSSESPHLTMGQSCVDFNLASPAIPIAMPSFFSLMTTVLRPQSAFSFVSEVVLSLSSTTLLKPVLMTACVGLLHLGAPLWGLTTGTARVAQTVLSLVPMRGTIELSSVVVVATAIDAAIKVYQQRRLLAALSEFQVECARIASDPAAPHDPIHSFIWPRDSINPEQQLFAQLRREDGILAVVAPDPSHLGATDGDYTQYVDAGGLYHFQDTTSMTLGVAVPLPFDSIVYVWHPFFTMCWYAHCVFKTSSHNYLHLFKRIGTVYTPLGSSSVTLGVPLAGVRALVRGNFAVRIHPAEEFVVVSRTYTPTAVLVPIMMWTALTERKQVSVYEVQTMLSAVRWSRYGLDPIDKDAATWVVAALGLPLADPAAHHYTWSRYLLSPEELGREAGHRIAAHAVDANGLFPRLGLANEITSVETRLLAFQTPEIIREQLNVDFPPDLLGWVAEFVSYLPNDLVIENVEEVMARQTRPTQRRQIAETLAHGFNIDQRTKMVGAMLKLEAYAEIKEPRNILNVNGPIKLPYSQVCGSMARALKTQPWYGFGSSPRVTAERVATILGDATHAIETDYSRYDGRILRLSRVACAMALERMFGEGEWLEWVESLYQQNIAASAVTTSGFRFNTGYSRLTGSPETSVMNTLFNAIAVYTALRELGLGQDAVWGLFHRSVVLAGDDGLMGVSQSFDATAYEASLNRWGLSVKATLRSRAAGDRCTFLARWYSPNWGSPNSCSDIRRQLPKLHLSTSACQTLTKEDELRAKALSIMSTDADTPVLGDWARVMLRLTGLTGIDRLVVEDMLRATADTAAAPLLPWSYTVDGVPPPSDWYPNQHEVWMDDALIFAYRGVIDSSSIHAWKSRMALASSLAEVDVIPPLVPLDLPLTLPTGVVVSETVHGPLPQTPLAQAQLQVRPSAPPDDIRASTTTTARPSRRQRRTARASSTPATTAPDPGSAGGSSPRAITQDQAGMSTQRRRRANRRRGTGAPAGGNPGEGAC